MGFPLTRFIQRPLTAYITSTNTASARVSARSITTTMAALLDNFKKPKYPPCGLVPFTEEQVEALLSDPNAIDYSKTKRKGFELWKDIGEPKYVVAPMVDQSEYVSQFNLLSFFFFKSYFHSSNLFHSNKLKYQGLENSFT